jgi:restriction system protein
LHDGRKSIMLGLVLARASTSPRSTRPRLSLGAIGSMDRSEPDWLESFRLWLAQAIASPTASPSTSNPQQGLLWAARGYQEESPVLRTEAEYQAAVEHLEYAVFRRYRNQLTRAERARLDNTIQNTSYKIDRYLDRLDPDQRADEEARYRDVRASLLQSRDDQDRLRQLARRAELKLSQLASLTPEGFEEFVAELFEALGYDVECCGGTGDDGVDILLRRDGQIAVAQCKYHKSQGVIGSPELRRFLGTIHHMHGHKGYFVTTRTFSLSAEKFAAQHPIELIDGPRLVQLVEEALGPVAKKEREPSLF